MGIYAVMFGTALIAVGIWGFVSTGSAHYTALIPAAIGLVIAALGAAAAAMGGQVRKHTMHAAAAIALVGAAMTVPGLIALVSLFTTSEQQQVKEGVSTATTPAEVKAENARGDTKYMAAVSKSATCLLCFAFVGLCVKSFIDARIARKAEAPPTAPPPQPTPV